MADLGLIAGGIGTGLSNFADTYQKQQQLQLQKQQVANQTAQTQSGLLNQGQQIDPTTGQVGFNDLGKAQQANKLSQAKITAQDYDPESNVTKSTLDTARKLYKLSRHEDADYQDGEENQTFPDNMTAAEVKGNPLFQDLADKGLQFNLAGKKLKGELAMKQATLGQKQNTESNAAGQSVENDKIIDPLNVRIQSLDRAKDLLTGKADVTAPSLMAAQQDIINAYDSSGRATEGKAAREILDPIAARINKGEAAVDIMRDIRKSAPNLVSNMLQVLDQTNGTLKQQRYERAKQVAGSFAASSNPKVAQTMQSKLDQYKTEATGSNNSSQGGMTDIQAAAQAELSRRQGK